MNTKVLSFAVLAAVVASCGEKNAQQSAPAAPELAVMTVSPSDAAFESSYPASIKGKTDIDIRPQVSGFITKVYVDEGQKVSKGQPLFAIDDVQYRAMLDQAIANVASARSAVATAQLTEQNKKRLLDKNIISDTEWQLAANQLSQARSALAQAEAAVVSARKNLSYTTVTAPSSGVVGSIPNREGSLASPSSAQPLTTISDNSDVYAYFSFSEKDLLDFAGDGSGSVDKAIKAMPDVQLELADGSRYPISGRVATVSGLIDPTTGAASARALFPNPNGLLRSGNTGKLIIPRTSSQVITVPQAATFEIQDLRYVYTLNDSNKTVATQISVDPYSDGKTFVVTSGLKPGDRIVTEGVGTSVRADMKITPKLK